MGFLQGSTPEECGRKSRLVGYRRKGSCSGIQELLVRYSAGHDADDAPEAGVRGKYRRSDKRTAQCDSRTQIHSEADPTHKTSSSHCEPLSYRLSPRLLCW